MNTDTITAAIQIAKALEHDPNTGTPGHGDLLAGLLNDKVLIRTVTMIYTGRVIAIDPNTIVLEEAAWIADTGRFAAALTTGELAEIEPYENHVYVSRNAVVDITRWDHPLPRNTK